jgi:hypothetical protein
VSGNFAVSAVGSFLFVFRMGWKLGSEGGWFSNGKGHIIMLCGVRGKLMLAFLLLYDRENSGNGGDGVKQHDLIPYGRIRVV